MAHTIQSAGNAGVILQSPAGRIYIDAFFRYVPHVGGAPALRAADALPAKLILVTHAHPDHIHPQETSEAALRSGAVVAGPAEVTRMMKGALPDERIVELEPPGDRRPPASVTRRIGDISVTAWRTYHGHAHNSYMVETDGMRFFHDGDNEFTQPYADVDLGRMDVLFLCPWAGSGAGEFMARTSPKKIVLIHLTEEETEQHLRGEFLPPLVSPMPEGAVALRPGQTLEID